MAGRQTQGQLDLFGKEIPAGPLHDEDFERVVSLLIRTEAAARHLTEYLQRTDRWAKTIVFCVNQEHADQMRQAPAQRQLRPDAGSTRTTSCGSSATRVRSAGATSSDFADTESDRPVIATTRRCSRRASTCRRSATSCCSGPSARWRCSSRSSAAARGCSPMRTSSRSTSSTTPGATALFADPEFDGPPERIDREEIDEAGRRRRGRRRRAA